MCCLCCWSCCCCSSLFIEFGFFSSCFCCCCWCCLYSFKFCVFLSLHFFPPINKKIVEEVGEKSMYECVNYVRIKSAYIYKECTQQPHTLKHKRTNTMELTQYRIIFGWNVCTSGVKKTRCVNNVKTKLTRERKINAYKHAATSGREYLWRIEKWITRRPEKKKKNAKRIRIPLPECWTW